jgi:hypothetical protein
MFVIAHLAGKLRQQRKEVIRDTSLFRAQMPVQLPQRPIGAMKGQSVVRPVSGDLTQTGISDHFCSLLPFCRSLS